jgi:NAD+ kinase
VLVAREYGGVADLSSQTVALVVNPTRPAAKELAERSRAWWEAQGWSVVVDDGDGSSGLAGGQLDFAVSLGGDGTMLRTVQLVLDWQVPVLGVNFGNLGYLTQVEPDGIESAFSRLVEGDFAVEERMTLEVVLRGVDGLRLVALNEVTVERQAPGHTIRVAVSIAGRPFLTYAADGVIVATPTGSTAYNLSARGPIVSPHLRAMILTPISPHMLFDRSLVLEPDETVGFDLLDGRRAVLSVDGSVVVPLGPDESVAVAAGERIARIVRFGRPDFHAILRGKFGLTDR